MRWISLFQASKEKSALKHTVKALLHSPSLERVGSRNDVRAVSAHQEAYTLVEGV